MYGIWPYNHMQEGESMAKCVLCEGKIVGGRCVDCGMDYSRMAEHRYRLNADCDEYDSRAKKINQEYEETLLGKGEKGAKQTKKTVVNPKASARPNQSRNIPRASAGSGQRTSGQTRANRSASASTPRQQEILQERKEWRKEEKKKKPAISGKLVGAVIIVFFVLLEIFDDIGLFDQGVEMVSQALSGDSDIYEEDDLYEEDDFDGALSTEGLYEWVTEEMPEEGEWVDLYLTAGNYIVGESIPQGTYTVGVSGEGTGYLNVEDEENFIWYYTALEDYDYVDDLRLYPGALVSIEGGCELNFCAENGQVDDLVPYEAPEDARSYTLEGNMEGDIVYEVTAGASGDGQVEPGRYDLLYGGEYGGIVVLAQQDTEGYVNNIALSAYGSGYEYPSEYKNLELSEGEILVVNVYADEGWIDLVPSGAAE